MVFWLSTHSDNAARINREFMAHMDRLFRITLSGPGVAFAPAEA
jgi:hypothetical protein